MSQKWFTLQHKLNNNPLCQHILFLQHIQYVNRTIQEYREPNIFKQSLFQEISCQFSLIQKMENSTEDIMLILVLWLSKSQHLKTLKLARQYYFTDSLSFLSEQSVSLDKYLSWPLPSFSKNTRCKFLDMFRLLQGYIIN